VTPAPRRISDREVPLQITGYFTPLAAPGTPVLFGMPGTDDLFLFVFETEEKLVEVMKSIDVTYEKIVVVWSGQELLASIAETNATGDRPYRIRIAIDPYKTENGLVRFLEPLPAKEPT
jgi:hypothetical protein